MIEVSISNIPLKFYTYFQWLLLGFYELSERKIIHLKLEKNIQHLLLRNNYLTGNKYSCFLTNKFLSLSPPIGYNSYCLTGSIAYESKIINFAYDIADSPFLFDDNIFNHCDLYFKAQCPQKIHKSGFELTNEIKIDYPFYIFDDLTKVKPAMLGVRKLSGGISHRDLQKGYQNLISSRQNQKLKKVFAYFGNSKGPALKEVGKNPNFDKENELMGFFKDRVNHPNEKRTVAVKYLNQLNDNRYEGRIIQSEGSDIGMRNGLLNKEIPLQEFSRYISQFEYNLNISGFRMSIPNRFIDSFIVGTAIITDKLHVCWYLPFDQEVFETVEMGYLPMENVNWGQFQKDLVSLPSYDQREIFEQYEEKWSPMKFAEYIIETALTN